ncbi:type II secretion system protein GspC [Vibrio breoganii]|uniref:Type II secretion system protein GspC n=1 Tax=Vibrio breoganii TaxID=553239 RepID=A0ABX1U704_9VIBR|nr:type II secretion system protein GspC [Vibrio breoganii]NMO73682.1 type II secretion system protein GspC [Vibrio breoganii]NMR70241.1 type II secretion system protein GspC [Vibrio breoganii]PML86749.1 type II secretion system protein GspC [Vibrio breoganii]
MEVGTSKGPVLSKFSTYSHKANQLLNSVVNQQAIIARGLTFVLLVTSAWLCGHLFWHLMGSESGVERWTPSTANVGTNTGQQQGADIAPLLNANLFGEESEDAPAVVEQVVDAPKTRLNLVLVGVVASSNQKSSLAVIANRGNQDTYGIGETIDGTRAQLRNVLKDRVIIENQGRNETLMLEGIEYRRVADVQEIVKQQPQSNVQGNNPEVDLGDLDSIKSAISENPQQFLKYIRLSQVNRDGKLVGYRVRPGKERALFDSVGLQDGDIAVELNGADLTDPSAMGEIWKSLGDLSEINLTVERDGQRYDIYLQL